MKDYLTMTKALLVCMSLRLLFTSGNTAYWFLVTLYWAINLLSDFVKGDK